MTDRQILDQIRSLAEPVVESMGLELVDAEYLVQGGRWVARIYIDREGGVTLDECAQVSRELSPVLDVKDVIPHEYVLEVSSPGLDRRLKKEKDFLWARGKRVRVRTREPLDGRRNFTGILRDFQEGELILDLDSGSARVRLEAVDRANVVFEFGNE